QVAATASFIVQPAAELLGRADDPCLGSDDAAPSMRGQRGSREFYSCVTSSRSGRGASHGLGPLSGSPAALLHRPGRVTLPSQEKAAMRDGCRTPPAEEEAKGVACVI